MGFGFTLDTVSIAGFPVFEGDAHKADRLQKEQTQRDILDLQAKQRDFQESQLQRAEDLANEDTLSLVINKAGKDASQSASKKSASDVLSGGTPDTLETKNKLFRQAYEANLTKARESFPDNKSLQAGIDAARDSSLSPTTLHNIYTGIENFTAQLNTPSFSKDPEAVTELISNLLQLKNNVLSVSKGNTQNPLVRNAITQIEHLETAAKTKLDIFALKEQGLTPDILFGGTAEGNSKIVDKAKQIPLEVLQDKRATDMQVKREGRAKNSQIAREGRATEAQIARENRLADRNKQLAIAQEEKQKADKLITAKEKANAIVNTFSPGGVKAVYQGLIDTLTKKGTVDSTALLTRLLQAKKVPDTMKKLLEILKPPPVSKGAKLSFEKARDELDTQLNSLVTVADVFEPAMFEFLSKTRVTAQNALSFFGPSVAKNDKGENRIISQNFIDSRQIVIGGLQSFFNAYKKFISGAAVSVQEFKDIQVLLPTKEDSPSGVRSKLLALVSSMVTRKIFLEKRLAGKTVSYVDTLRDVKKQQLAIQQNLSTKEILQSLLSIRSSVVLQETAARKRGLVGSGLELSVKALKKATDPKTNPKVTEFIKSFNRTK